MRDRARGRLKPRTSRPGAAVPALLERLAVAQTLTQVCCGRSRSSLNASRCAKVLERALYTRTWIDSRGQRVR